MFRGLRKATTLTLRLQVWNVYDVVGKRRELKHLGILPMKLGEDSTAHLWDPGGFT